MRDIEITKTSDGFQIEGYPDAVKVIELVGPKARRLSDLALHKIDLDFASECLDQINDTTGNCSLLKQALWRSAIVHFMKCFGNNVFGDN